jgi:hypothetical protein
MPSPVEIKGATGANLNLTEDGEVWTTETEREHNVRASYVLTGIQASTWAVLIDLSDTTNFPHDNTGRIDISQISMQVDRGSNSVGLMQIGVVTRVDGVNGDVSTFGALRFENNSDTHVVRDVNLSPSQIKCGVADGITSSMITNAAILNDTGLQTDVALGSPRGAATVNPSVGDIVIKFTHTSGGAWTGAAGVLYHSHE